MGNVASVSFKRNFSDQQFSDALQEIVTERFSDRIKIDIEYFGDEIDASVIGPNDVSLKSPYR